MPAIGSQVFKTFIMKINDLRCLACLLQLQAYMVFQLPHHWVEVVLN
jgi:hypothetical protein